jgi:hypothetical protein
MGDKFLTTTFFNLFKLNPSKAYLVLSDIQFSLISSFNLGKIRIIESLFSKSFLEFVGELLFRVYITILLPKESLKSTDSNFLSSQFLAENA